MNIELSTSPVHEVAADWLIVPVPTDARASSQITALDKATDGLLTRLRESDDLPQKPGELLPLVATTGLATPRLLLVGLPESDKLDAAGHERTLMTAVRRISEKPTQHVAIALPELPGDALSAETAASLAATTLHVGSVGQDWYRSEQSRYPFARGTIVAEANGLADAVQAGSVLGESVNLARELINRPANDVYPETFADRARQLAGEHGIDCDVLDERRLKEEKMGAMLAVAQGSVRPPRAVVLTYRGADDDLPTYGLIGKGVTFDSGGLSLKTNDGMKTMKADMSGAASVLAAITAVARLKLPVNVMAAMGLVENMPGGNSYKLGDVLRTRSGQTVEVLNTDAEGRLVLADVLSYAVDQGAGRLIDVATLTGACMVALGPEVTGAFSNNQPWCDEVLTAAGAVGEPVWQMPMFESFNEQLKSDVADTKNVGTRWGGAVTAAKFLEKFVAETPWVHLDVAGTAWADSSKPHREGGATGVIVRTLVETVRQAT